MKTKKMKFTTVISAVVMAFSALVFAPAYGTDIIYDDNGNYIYTEGLDRYYEFACDFGSFGYYINNSYEDFIEACHNRFDGVMGHWNNKYHRNSFWEWFDGIDTIYIPKLCGKGMDDDEYKTFSIGQKNDYNNFQVYFYFSFGYNYACCMGYEFLDKQSEEKVKAQGIADFFEETRPDEPNIYNIDSISLNFPSKNFTSVYETEIQLSDRVVNAFVREYTIYTESYTEIFLNYDNMLVCILSQPNKAYTSFDWFSELSFEKISLRDEAEIIYGDLIGKGRPTLGSIILLSRYLTAPEQNPLTDEQLKAADLNGDGVVTQLDLILLTRHILENK